MNQGRAVLMTEGSTGASHEPPGSRWYDNEAGPLVRPYAMTGGRTRPGPNGAHFDLIALVSLDSGAPGADVDTSLGPEHRALAELCRTETQSVAELPRAPICPSEWCGYSSATSWNWAASPSAALYRPRSCRTNGSCVR